MSGNSDHKLERIDPKPVHIPGNGPLLVNIETRLGTITGRLFEQLVPKTVANFASLALGKVTGEPYYDGLVFHRVIPEFMIHGGCPHGDGSGGPDYATPEESAEGLSHDRGGLFTLLYLHRDLGGAQFIITETATPWYDRNHTIFGEVVEGMDILKKIARVPADKKNRPLEPIAMDRVTVYRAD